MTCFGAFVVPPARSASFSALAALNASRRRPHSSSSRSTSDRNRAFSADVNRHREDSCSSRLSTVGDSPGGDSPGRRAAAGPVRAGPPGPSSTTVVGTSSSVGSTAGGDSPPGGDSPGGTHRAVTHRAGPAGASRRPSRRRRRRGPRSARDHPLPARDHPPPARRAPPPPSRPAPPPSPVPPPAHRRHPSSPELRCREDRPGCPRTWRNTRGTWSPSRTRARHNHRRGGGRTR